MLFLERNIPRLMYWLRTNAFRTAQTLQNDESGAVQEKFLDSSTFPQELFISLQP